jgi:hypothetical protein
MDELEYHKAALDRWETEPWPALTDEDQDEVHRLLDAYATARAGRVATHRARLIREACRLGHEVRAYRVTLADAERQLDTLARMTDPETPEIEIALIDYQEACEIIRGAFRSAL